MDYQKKEKKGKNMFNLELKIPTYEEWKAQMSKHSETFKHSERINNNSTNCQNTVDV